MAGEPSNEKSALAKESADETLEAKRSEEGQKAPMKRPRDDKNCVVEKIVDKRAVPRGSTEYYVQWRDHGE